MNKENMFEVAVRGKFRFNFKGVLSVEDLWDLSVRDLDSVFKVLNSQVKQAKEESLLDTKSKEDEVLDTKIEIVKYIVKVKQEEDSERLKAKENREKKQKLLSVLADKENEEILNKSADEIRAMINELGE
jgi:polyphosphate kinase 2 (PPK2 family)